MVSHDASPVEAGVRLDLEGTCGDIPLDYGGGFQYQLLGDGEIPFDLALDLRVVGRNVACDRGFRANYDLALAGDIARHMAVKAKIGICRDVAGDVGACGHGVVQSTGAVLLVMSDFHLFSCFVYHKVKIFLG